MREDLPDRKLRVDAHPRRFSSTIAEPLEAVARAIEELKFGAIVLTLHEGRVVQLEVTERKRFG